MLYQQDYPDTAMSGSVGSYRQHAAEHPSAPAMAPWLHGRGQAGQLALTPRLGSDRLCAAGGDL